MVRSFCQEIKEKDSIADIQQFIERSNKVAGRFRARAQRGCKMGAGMQWAAKSNDENTSIKTAFEADFLYYRRGSIV